MAVMSLNLRSKLKPLLNLCRTFSNAPLPVCSKDKSKFIADYKVIRFLIPKTKDTNMIAELYSLATDSWKPVNIPPHTKPCCGGIRVNDSYYWINISQMGFIMSFNFVTEKFGSRPIHVPQSEKISRPYCNLTLVEFGGSLGAVVYTLSYPTDDPICSLEVWVWDESIWTWSLVSTFDVPRAMRAWSLVGSDNKIIFGESLHLDLMFFDYATGKLENIAGAPQAMPSVFLYRRVLRAGRFARPLCRRRTSLGGSSGFDVPTGFGLCEDRSPNCPSTNTFHSPKLGQIKLLTPNYSAMANSSGSDVEAGFAKLQGEDFEYYMQTYSIILGRNSKKSTVDVDLSSLGGGMNISRHHARIFYDFQRRRFALEGVLHLPGNPPVKLDSQDLLQIGDKEFYFLLPVRSILGGPIGPRHHVANHHHHDGHQSRHQQQRHLILPPVLGGGVYGKKGRVREEYYEGDYNEEEDLGRRTRRIEAGVSGQLDKNVDGRSRVNREADNNQLLQLEEKDVVSSVATVLSDLCGPGEWMPMEKLQSELMEQYGNVWHHSRVRRYLTSEDYSVPEAQEKPWYGLLVLLRKYPEHFVINTRSKGRITHEFVSLVSLIS
ncbi:SMAD/FHA domain-containing protein [Striga asiatica]|uniref:SMAD/FHA domain-containing protein n=1 Tax=Striga asiatica TaxID=4170 RepID=A0A5A7Q885_STRAF|nr:SMAD/FHA domain-containing protein [Striga asiatica]